MYSPSPSSLLVRSLSVYSGIFQKTATITGLALFLLVLGISNVSAQTRPRRAESEEGSKRVEDKNRAGATEPGKRDMGKQATANPLVRKTALTYPTQPNNQAQKRPALVNDITVVSRVSEKPSPIIPSSAGAKTAGAASAFIPSIWPVVGPLRSGVGMRSNPFGGSSIEFHKGQDIAVPIGTPVVATADGTIVVAGWQRGYGWVVYIDHGNGISTRYGHLSRIDVTVGQTIKRGEQLGLTGSTGRSTGPHLHYEVRVNGQPVNPLMYLPSMPVPASANEKQGQLK